MPGKNLKAQAEADDRRDLNPAPDSLEQKLHFPFSRLAIRTGKRLRSTAHVVQQPRSMTGIGKRFVYVLRSDRDPARHYVGLTGDVENRLEWHNHGPCGHTVHDRPWSLAVVIEVPSEQQATQFEKYLKTGSGRAFTKRHFAADH